MSRTLEILERLIAFPTISAQSNLALIDYVQDLLINAGFSITRIASPCGEKAGLHARLGQGHGGVCLSAHSDVVPVEGQEWSVPPFHLTQKGARVHGRGVCDMKGFLASALAMAEQAAGVDLKEPLSIVVSYDEEIGCLGIRDMLPALKPLMGTPRAVIVGEPTSMRPAIGHKGKTALDVICHGQAGHSALAPQFVNAIHVAAAFIQGIQELQAELAQGPQDSEYDVAYSTLHIGRIDGGRALNIVPDFARMQMEFRHLPETAAASIRQRIEDVARRIAKPFGDNARICVKETNAYPGLNTAPDAQVVQWACELVGARTTSKVAFGTEAGFFAALGLPTVVLGPGDMGRDGHKPDEGLDIEQLQRCDAMMIDILNGLKGLR